MIYAVALVYAWLLTAVIVVIYKFTCTDEYADGTRYFCNELAGRLDKLEAHDQEMQNTKDPVWEVVSDLSERVARLEQELGKRVALYVQDKAHTQRRLEELEVAKDEEVAPNPLASIRAHLELLDKTESSLAVSYTTLTTRVQHLEEDKKEILAHFYKLDDTTAVLQGRIQELSVLLKDLKTAFEEQTVANALQIDAINTQLRKRQKITKS